MNTMKKFLFLTVISVFGLLLSCKSSVDTTTEYPDSNTTVSTETTEMEEPAEEMEETPTMENDEGMEYDDKMNTDSNIETDDEMAMDETMSADYSEMYDYLEMSDDQIDQFNTAMEDFKTAVDNDPNGEMKGTMDDRKDAILEDILTPEQMAKYAEWKKNN